MQTTDTGTPASSLRFMPPRRRRKRHRWRLIERATRPFKVIVHTVKKLVAGGHFENETAGLTYGVQVERW
jgi:hypothetical protein